MTRIEQQIGFLMEADRLKGVLRKTSPIGISRRENAAEHSWQVILSALTLLEHSKETIDILKVLKMLALHDLAEMDTGDTFHYDKPPYGQGRDEDIAAAKRIFGMLPREQGEEYFDIWLEFEMRQTAEAKFANAVDRLMAFLTNPKNEGGSWKEFGITLNQVLEKNGHIRDGSETIWEEAEKIARQAVCAGLISGE